jgi:hypothetical protein
VKSEYLAINRQKVKKVFLQLLGRRKKSDLLAVAREEGKDGVFRQSARKRVIRVFLAVGRDVGKEGVFWQLTGFESKDRFLASW